MGEQDLQQHIKTSLWMARCELREVRRMRNADGYTAADIHQALNLAALSRRFAVHYLQKVSMQRKGGGAEGLSSKSASPVRAGDAA